MVDVLKWIIGGLRSCQWLSKDKSVRPLRPGLGGANRDRAAAGWFEGGSNKLFMVEKCKFTYWICVLKPNLCGLDWKGIYKCKRRLRGVLYIYFNVPVFFENMFGLHIVGSLL